MFAIRVAAMPRPSSQRASRGTGTRCRAAYNMSMLEAYTRPSIVAGSNRAVSLSRSKMGCGCWPAVSSWRQAARLYSLISPFRMDFRRIRWPSRLTAVTPGASRSPPGIRWAMP